MKLIYDPETGRYIRLDLSREKERKKKIPSTKVYYYYYQRRNEAPIRAMVTCQGCKHIFLDGKIWRCAVTRDRVRKGKLIFCDKYEQSEECKRETGVIIPKGGWLNGRFPERI